MFNFGFLAVIGELVPWRTTLLGDNIAPVGMPSTSEILCKDF